MKLYKELTTPQKKKIRSIGFGGLLKIGSQTLPTGFADWLMGDCYDANSSELVFPGRGRIKVNAESVCATLGIPKDGDEVKYEMNVDAINFIHEKFGLDEGCAPSIDSILKRLKDNKTVDDNFIRSWLMIAISTFLCPPTGIAISPQCYPAIVDLSQIDKLNWCQFVVDQLKVAASKKGTKQSFKGCLLVLVVSFYLHFFLLFICFAALSIYSECCCCINSNSVCFVGCTITCRR